MCSVFLVALINREPGGKIMKNILLIESLSTVFAYQYLTKHFIELYVRMQ